MNATTKPVETYRHVEIFHDADEGYHASAGVAVHFGYHESIADIRAEIDDHWAEEATEAPLDTPSLDTSFHDQEMGR